MRIVDCEQGTQEWLDVRAGIPTASCINKILTPAKMEISKSRDGYMHDLVEERLGVFANGYQSVHMKNGTEREEEAIAFYELMSDEDTQVVGFCLADDGRSGCGPDRLVGEDGGVEAKAPKLITHLKYVKGRILPNEYKLQVYDCLLVTGRKWWDFISYFKGAKPFIIRTYAKDIQGDLNTIASAKKLFCDDLDKLEKESRL